MRRNVAPSGEALIFQILRGVGDAATCGEALIFQILRSVGDAAPCGEALIFQINASLPSFKRSLPFGSCMPALMGVTRQVPLPSLAGAAPRRYLK